MGPEAMSPRWGFVPKRAFSWGLHPRLRSVAAMRLNACWTRPYVMLRAQNVTPFKQNSPAVKIFSSPCPSKSYVHSHGPFQGQKRAQKWFLPPLRDRVACLTMRAAAPGLRSTLLSNTLILGQYRRGEPGVLGGRQGRPNGGTCGRVSADLSQHRVRPRTSRKTDRRLIIDESPARTRQDACALAVSGPGFYEWRRLC